MTLKVITPQQLTAKVLSKENLFILDVRNESEFQDWKVEGENINYLNIPYFDLIDGIEPIVDKVPKNKDVVVICAKGGSAIFVGEQLVEAGFDNIYTLEAGMQGWSQHLEKVKVYEDNKVKVYQFIRVGKGCLSYMVVSGNEALIIDPARFLDDYIKVATEEGAQITHILDSHLHADHISGGKALAEKVGAKYYLMKSEGAVFDFEALESYEKIEFNQVQLEVLAVKTPGHTPGSVSFLVNDKLLFSGDTIFISGLGRPDLGNKVREWANDLYNTVHTKVSKITDDVIVLPGHYADLDTEINSNRYIGDQLGNIRKRNENMFTTPKDEFITNVEKSASSVKPPNFEEIVEINRGVEQADTTKMMELEIGPNRCAVHHTA